MSSNKPICTALTGSCRTEFTNSTGHVITIGTSKLTLTVTSNVVADFQKILFKPLQKANKWHLMSHQ